MASSMGMLQVGVGAALFIFSEIVLVMIFDPLLSTVVPMMQEMTPPYWWNYLGGNMIVWIIPMIWTIMTLAGVIVIVRMMIEPGNKVSYEHEW